MRFYRSSAFPIISYCCSSIMMTVTNKFVFSGSGFNLNFFLLFLQSLICVCIITLGKSYGMIEFRDFRTSEARKWLPVTLFLILMIYSSSKALRYLSIPVYTIFKNLTIILIAYGEVLWFGGKVTNLILSSFVLMVVSSVIAAWSDIRIALGGSGIFRADAAENIAMLNTGYAWIGLNCLCSAMYALMMHKRINLSERSDFETMFYNNVLSMPIIIVCSILFEDWGAANIRQNFPSNALTQLFFAIFLSGVSTVAISYSTAICFRRTSSTTYSMIGALNK